MTNIYTQLAKALNIAEFTEDYTPSADLQISEYMTADSYEVHVMTNDERNVDWENDVYYYEPQFEDIMQRIVDTVSDVMLDVKIYVSDLETYLPEEEVLNWLEQNKDE